ncbi:TPA: hypothetical protein N0F65_000869 [Lagenidium giganteum]|uniref:Uncharacterized protein n=1 Tax=Lagenidium giganteum TaxID=4803 RepID=A0AAV2YZ61_9STRA|nr:TPA: hypothetical protein N0F65_000869 [Lagenidium giganteum]
MGAGVNGTKNLREAVGASKMDYKPLGSKFIRLADLHNNVLNLKHNNRTSAMNKLKMSDALTKLIKELTFDGNINQQLYNSLPHSEQNVLVKVLKLTHLYYSDKSVLEDPNKRLIQEFDKLRGEIALGNNNPDLIRELKLITMDLHAQKIISDNDCRSIIVNLP